MWTNEQRKAAERLRELAHDRVASPYLVGVLLASTEPDEWPDIVQAALVYRERFGALGNDRAEATTPLVAGGNDALTRAQQIVREQVRGEQTLPDL